MQSLWLFSILLSQLLRLRSVSFDTETKSGYANENGY